MPLSTTSAVLKREGLGKLGRIGLEPAQRYERARPGELIHIDVKKLGRIVGGAGHRITGPHGRRDAVGRTIDAAGRQRCLTGWEFVHIAIDDATRLAYAEVLTDENATTAIAFLKRAVEFFARHGIRVEQLLTDNGPGLPLHHPRCRLPHARHPPLTHPAAPATDQRQSRALHPHAAKRLGLRRDLRLKRRTHRSP
jgi:hypothetical protein